MEKDIKITSKKNKEATNIEIIWRDKQDLIDLGDKKEFSNYILKTSYHTIIKAIEEDLDTVELFNIFNVSLIIELKRSNFKPVLEKIKDMFSSQEDYEKCAKIKSIIKKL